MDTKMLWTEVHKATLEEEDLADPSLQELDRMGWNI